MTYTYSELISYFVGILGIIMTIVYFTFLKGKTVIKVFFSSYLLMASLTIILGALTYSGKILMFPHLFRIIGPIHYLFPPVALFYTWSSFKPDFKFKKIYLINFLPFLINFIEFLPFYFSPTSEKVELINQLLASGSVVMPGHYLLKDINTAVYLFVQFYIFFKYKPGKNIRTKYMDSLVKWFWIYLSGQFLIIIGMTTEILWNSASTIEPYHLAINMITIFVFMTSIAFLFFPSLLYGNMDEHEVAKEKYANSRLSESDKNDMLAALNLYLKSQEKPYLNPKLSIEDVSSKLGILPKQLSQVINEKTGSNFNQFVNTFRVEESKVILGSSLFDKLTIDAISEKSGFKSKSTFYAAFKTHTGMTPKQFVENTGKH
ncbi:MAG: AraC family transcriptional regulator [Bacteroidetes bacterium]|nr:AraC family transcriptional regulator [Bacteroidota bacterium]